MISVIVSTRHIDENYVNMIKKTSGVKDVEVLMYENKGEIPLTEVYNKGLNESKNNIVVFAHDDINILTKNWGNNLIKHYEESDYGILGVAGTKILPQNGVWWTNRESMYGCVRHSNGNKTWLNEYSYNFGNKIKDVVVVDGVFMSCSKNKIKKSFNEEYTDFHFYDISFCFDNFKSGVRIGVHFDISIVHNSIGETNDKWEDNRKLFVSKESLNLPAITTIDFTYPEPIVNIRNERKLAIIIPTKNKVENLLLPCINSIMNNTRYHNYKIYIADTGSSDDELNLTRGIVNAANANGEIIRLVEYDYYNFAKINNDMVKNKIDTDTELVLFCNNDIEMLNDAVSIMVQVHENTKKVGTVGCRLHYENGSVQHLGISLKVNSTNQVSITHRYLNWDNDNVRLSKTDNHTHGNTAAFMLVSKSLFLEVGGFNEDYNQCFEDVEFNLQCILKNKSNITTSRAVCYHLESQTRDRAGENVDLQMLLKFINKNKLIKQILTPTN